MNIRKLLAGGLAATFAGATLAFGAIATSANLGEYVTPGSGGALSSPRLVIGSSAGDATAYPLDVAASGDLAAAVAGYATTTVNIAGGSTTTVSGGTDVATTNKKLYFHSVLNRARTTLTETQLPVLLASGEASVDLSGTYKFDQYINLGTSTSQFDRNNGAFTDPTLYLDIGYSATGTPVYNTTIVFSKALNVSHADVQGGTLKLLNVEYTIGSGSGPKGGATPNNKLVLQGGAGSTVVDVGGSTTVSLAGVTHTAEVTSVADTNTAVIVVDGQLKEVTEGNTYSITGNQGTVDVYVKGVYYAGEGAGTSQVELVIGTSKITLENGQAAKEGTNDDTIQGTHCYVTGDASGISKVVVSVSGPEASQNYITDSFFDPVFGSFKVAVNGFTPAVGDSSRDTVTIDNAGTTGATASITDYRGNSKTFQYVYNGTSQPQLNYSSTRAIHVLEGEAVSLNEYFLMAPEQESDFGHIMQLTSVSNIGGSNPSFSVQDVLSDNSLTFYLTSSADAAFKKTFYVDGQTYYGRNVTGTQKMNYTWGDTTASDGDVGAKATVFPLIRLAGGEYVTFVQNQTFPAASFNLTNTTATTILELPTGDLNITVANYSAALEPRVFVNGTAITVAADSEVAYDYAGGQVNYKLGIEVQANSSRSFMGTVEGPMAVVKWIHPATTYIQKSNNNNLVGVMVLQEADNTTTTKDAVITGLDYSSTDGTRVEQLAAGITGAKDGEARSSDSNMYDYVNAYGTVVTYATVSESQGKVDIFYPDDQAVVTVGVGLDPSFSTAATGGSYEAAYQITDPVVMLDNEVSATSSLPYDLILVGGPCANTVVASALSGEGITCANWAYSTGIIKEVENVFSSGKKALIVAGTTASDTRSLAAQVLDGTMSYSA